MVPMARLSTGEYFLQMLNSSVGFEIAKALALARTSSNDINLPSESNSSRLLLNSDLAVRSIPNEEILDNSLVNDSNHTDYVSTTQTPANEFPIYVIVIIGLVSLAMTTTFLYFLCRCLMRKKKRENQLANLTPKTFDPRMAGVRASQPIEFVVPSTIIVSETTEDSISETDYSSSGTKMLPILLEKRKKRSGFQINPEELQHGLYVGVTSASEKGFFLGDLGKVGFSVRYSLQRSQLTVKIIGAKDLPCLFMKTTANPFVKLVLLPERTTKYMTKVQRNTTSPTFNESFSFPVRRDELSDKKLKITVWDYDRFSRKCLMGQVVYNVKDSGITNTLSVDVTSGDIWVNLKQDSATPQGCGGEMLLSLCYNPDTANLTLSVLKVRGLDMQQDKGKETSIYAKVTLYVRRKLVRTKKTPTRKKAPEIEFNSPFSIHVPQAALKEVDLMVVLCEKYSLGKRILGRTQAGTNCLCEQGLQHWQDMLASPKSTCAQWHTLCG